MRITFFLLLVFRICSSQAQETIEPIYKTAVADPGKQDFEAIAEKSLKINGYIGYDTTTEEITSLYGNPETVSDVYWEIGDVTAKYYYYNGAVFKMLDDTFESFEITSSLWYIDTGNMLIEVGTSIEPIKNYYSDAYSTRENGNLVIFIGSGDHKYLLVKFNSNNIITGIEQRIF